MKSAITTHVLDTAAGQPAAGILVTLHRDGREIGRGSTDQDGRVMTDMIREDDFMPGEYRIVFETADYLSQQTGAAFYPRVSIEFVVDDGQDHYHIPVLLSPFGYTTYRGS